MQVDSSGEKAFSCLVQPNCVTGLKGEMFCDVLRL